MTYLGAYTVGSTVTYLFTSRNSAGRPAALVSTSSVDMYKDGGTTQATALGSLTTNFDSVTGLNMLVVASADSAGFFTADSEFAAVLQGIASVSDASIAGEVICSFSLNNGALPTNSINSSSFSADAFIGSTQSIAIKPGAYSTVTVGTGNITPGTYSGVTLGVNNIAGGTYSDVTVQGLSNYANISNVTLHAGTHSGATVQGISNYANISNVTLAAGTHSGATIQGISNYANISNVTLAAGSTVTIGKSLITLNANIVQITGDTVTGSGTTADPWVPA